ncbi:MAG: DUF502 domain-containing protein [Candidatus Margulisbacteria bacterium]|nr:DUF502 domain-containing protein [Candidatus Margulisiibacteriota bacterium]
MNKKPLLIRLIQDLSSKESVNRFQKNLLTGFFVALPSIATIWILSIIIRIIGTPFGKIINNLFADGRMDPFYELILGFIIAIAFLASLGYFAKLAFMRTISKTIENYIETIPVINAVYTTIKSIISAVRSNSKSFQSVAIIQYPSKGIYTIGFITQKNFPTMKTKTGTIHKNMTSVFVPTTPNPTSGFFVLLPKDEVEILDIPIEDGLKLIISAGAISPKEKAELLQNDAFVKK